MATANIINLIVIVMTDEKEEKRWWWADPSGLRPKTVGL